mmetsp:Transcript_93596/g.238330  ORF Transcript_93596/g.238330 Transcript_93596/m.238330 type:complete len:364 (-) Transcript_93596:438-1529(-)
MPPLGLGAAGPRLPTLLGSESAMVTARGRVASKTVAFGQATSGSQVGNGSQQQWRPSNVGGPLWDISNVGTNQIILPGFVEPKFAAAPPAASPRPPSAGATASEDAEEAGEYIQDILDVLFRKELNLVPDANYMDAQPEIDTNMRNILLDWLIDVQIKYKMKQDTLFLTACLLDRYLSRKHVPRSRLQLIGVVAMFVAAKFEEIDPPNAASLVYITDNAYSKSDIFNTECSFLATLGFEVLVPTASNFLDYMQRANNCDAFHRSLAEYVLELTLLDHRMLRHPPSLVAAASLLLSNELMGRNPSWSSATARVARHSKTAILPIAGELRGLLDAAPGGNLQAIYRKYSSKDRSKVSSRMAAAAR